MWIYEFHEDDIYWYFLEESANLSIIHFFVKKKSQEMFRDSTRVLNKVMATYQENNF